jgi:hypothetical protein
MPLDITPFANAVGRLREGLERHQREPSDEQLRDGLIQRFESTHEFCHRTLKRHPADRRFSGRSGPNGVSGPHSDCQRARLALGGLAGLASLSRPASANQPHLSGRHCAAGGGGHSRVSGRGRVSARPVAVATGMSPTIDRPHEDLAILLPVLHTSLPFGTSVWVFGSRVTGAARRYSDLDLALLGPREVGFGHAWPIEGSAVGIRPDN